MDPQLLKDLISITDGVNVTADDFARFKAHRENGVAYPKPFLQKVSRGEPALALAVLTQDGKQLPVEWLKTWWAEERIPDDFKVNHTAGLTGFRPASAAMSAKVQEYVEKFRAE